MAKKKGGLNALFRRCPLFQPDIIAIVVMLVLMGDVNLITKIQIHKTGARAGVGAWAKVRVGVAAEAGLGTAKVGAGAGAGTKVVSGAGAGAGAGDWRPAWICSAGSISAAPV